MAEYLDLKTEIAIEEAEPAAAERPGFFNVLFGMLFHPVRTLDASLDHPIEAYTWGLAALGGLYLSHLIAVSQQMGEHWPFTATLAGIVLLGPPCGLAFLYVGGLMMNWASDVLDAHAPRKKLRTVLGYAGVPGLVAFICFGVPRLLFFRERLFAEGFVPQGETVLGWGLLVGDALCFAWSVGLLVHGLRMITGFTPSRAMQVLLLAVTPVLLVAAVMAFLILAPSILQPEPVRPKVSPAGEASRPR